MGYITANGEKEMNASVNHEYYAFSSFTGLPPAQPRYRSVIHA